MPTIDIIVNSDGAVSAVKVFNSSLDDLSKKADDSGEHLGKVEGALQSLIGQFTVASLAASAISGAFSEIKGAFSAVLAVTEEAENAQVGLSNALLASGRSVEGNLEHYTEFATAQQNMTTYSRAQVEQIQALALMMSGKGQQAIDDITRGAIGLSAVTGRDLNASVRAVTLAYEGNFVQLSRFIPAVREAVGEEAKHAAMVQALAAFYKAAEAQTQTFSGQMETLKHVFNDAAIEVGNAVVKNADLRQTIADIKAAIVLAEPDIKRLAEDITRFVSGLAKFASEAIDWIHKVRSAIGDMSGELPAYEKQWESWITKMGGVSPLINAISFNITKMHGSVDQADAAVAKMNTLMDEAGGSATKFGEAILKGAAGPQAAAALRAIAPPLAKAYDEAEKAKQGIKDLGTALDEVPQSQKDFVALQKEISAALTAPQQKQAMADILSFLAKYKDLLPEASAAVKKLHAEYEGFADGLVKSKEVFSGARDEGYQLAAQLWMAGERAKGAIPELLALGIAVNKTNPAFAAINQALKNAFTTPQVKTSIEAIIKEILAIGPPTEQTAKLVDALRHELNMLGTDAKKMESVWDQAMHRMIDSATMFGTTSGGVFAEVGKVFGKMTEDVMAGEEKMVLQQMLDAHKGIATAQADSTSSLISSIFKSIPYPFNIILAAGAFALVDSLFSKIMKFEAGGTFRQPTIAMLGEGTQTEYALDAPKLTGIVRDAMAGTAPASGAQGGATITVNYHVHATSLTSQQINQSMGQIFAAVEQQARKRGISITKRAGRS